MNPTGAFTEVEGTNCEQAGEEGEVARCTGALIDYFEALTQRQQQHQQRQVDWIATELPYPPNHRASANSEVDQVDRTTVDHEYGASDHGGFDRRYVPHSAAMGDQLHFGLILAQAAATGG